jgi:hypothetical protein
MRGQGVESRTRPRYLPSAFNRFTTGRGVSASPGLGPAHNGESAMRLHYKVGPGEPAPWVLLADLDQTGPYRMAEFS